MRIDEETVGVLFSDEQSRPNIPVNVQFGLEMLKADFGWSDEELYDTFYYNVPVRYALGCRDVSEGHFELRTLYNYRQRLTNHMQGTGENLSESRMQPDLHGCLLLVVFTPRPEKRHIPSLRVLKNKPETRLTAP